MRIIAILPVTLILLCSFCERLAAQDDVRLELRPAMVVNESDIGEPAGLVDEQKTIIGPPAGKPTTSWKIGGQHNKKYPFSMYLDLGAEKNLSKLWIFDTNGDGDVVISSGKPGEWKELTTYGCGVYMKWVSIPLDVTTRYLRLTRKSPNANFTEIAVYEYTPEALAAMKKRKEEEARKEAIRKAALDKAMAEMKKRPLVDLGPPFGKLYLIDEVDCTKTDHEFAEDPKSASRVETVKGRSCRIISKTKGESAYFTYRIGKMKLLQPGASYVLAIDYPEDAPRTVIVSNTGNETTRGFHTGLAVGDSFHAKYVNSLNESIDVPLSGKWETWTHLFRLHDRFTKYNGLPRGGAPRPFTPEDGFYVTIAQFSAKNIPMSKGAAVSRIRLFAVTEPEKLIQKINYPPKELPRRRLFWREEMADGVLGGKNRFKKGNTGYGVSNFLDWYKFKAQRMQFLGMNTFTKDLLEFGACQGWDSTPHGGNQWVYFGSEIKHYWNDIVELMGKYGFELLPYYEYSGSKGQKGLGFERRCKPLTRKDGYYTHIKWVEKATADITDPDTYEDFKKMLDITVIRNLNKAKFAGIWLRPRSQLPISFADATLKRFGKESRNNKAVTRKMLIDDKALYRQYINWWGIKRKEFLTAMRDYLRENGVDDALVLFTGCPGEPGVGFPSWDPVMVTDKPEAWLPVLKQKDHTVRDGATIQPLTVDTVAKEDRYLKGLLAPGLDWGGYEVRHARPADDPHNYHDVEGVMLSHAFNRLYTVVSPKTFSTFRTKSGLTVIRHYSLNENMMFDSKDKPKLGYFCTDMERTGPYCMMAEAVAMANGDPTMIGYLSGGNFARGFPQYVRNFNSAFLSLPALPSTVLKGAATDSEVVVRQIKTEKHGSYFSIVNTSRESRQNVTVTLPVTGSALDSATGKPVKTAGGKLSLSLYPYQLRAIHIK